LPRFLGFELNTVYQNMRIQTLPPVGKRDCWLANRFRRKIEFFVFVPLCGTPEADFSLFCLLDLKLFGIIILEDSISLTCYQIIEIMARENKIGENIKEVPNKTRLVGGGFCQKIQRQIYHLTKIESGVIKKPSALVMAKIAKALGVNIEKLIK